MRSCAVLSFSRSFGWPGVVACASVTDHLPEDVDVVVATTGLDDDVTSALEREVSGRDRRLRIVDSTHWVDEMPSVSRYVPDTWTRVFLADVLPPEYERVVYLDADSLTLASLDDLIRMPLGADLLALTDPEIRCFADRGAAYVAASGGPADAPYFNTGVLVVDRSRWSGVSHRAKELVEAGSLPLDLVDQDVLNVVMRGRWKELDGRWHRQLSPDGPVPEGAVLHYTGPVKPWEPDAPDGPARRLYREAARSVGWVW